MDSSASNTIAADELLTRQSEPGPPATEYECKMVMLRAERHDRIHITDVVSRIVSGYTIPSEVTVAERKNPYYGPELILEGGDSPLRLTSPGPDSQLLLWKAHLTDRGNQYGWQKVAEVTAQFLDDQPQYDLCPECGQPMQTIEHERRAAVGRCPGPETS